MKIVYYLLGAILLTFIVGAYIAQNTQYISVETAGRYAAAVLLIPLLGKVLLHLIWAKSRKNAENEEKKDECSDSSGV